MKGEGDFVASTKEAEQAGQQLIKERETLAEKIQKLKVPLKRMITHLEIEKTSNCFKHIVNNSTFQALQARCGE